MTKIEQVARAIYEADDVWSAAFPWPTMASKEQSPDNYRRIARAAIEAMREPTGEMSAAGGYRLDNEGGYYGADDVWADMIDAALNEQPA